MKIKRKDFILSTIILISLSLRILSIVFYGDDEIANEWGDILRNLKEKNILSIRDINGVPVPNIFMPPLYAFFLYFINFFFTNSDSLLIGVKIIQLFLSLISVYLMYRICLNFFSQNLSYIGAIIFSIFPLNIYAVGQISSITIQLFLLSVFLLSFIKIFKGKKIKYLIMFSISSGLMILLRGEFFLFVILTLIYHFLKNKDVKQLFFVTILISLVLLPYIQRNYEIFNTFTITKSGGYNLLKGNNPSSKVEGVKMFRGEGEVVPNIKSKLDALNKMGPIKEHDLLIDKIYLDQALIYIKDDPSRYIKLYFKKFLAFMFIDIESSYPNYYSILNILPKILISITTIISIYFLLNLKLNLYNYLIFYYFSNIGLFSFFFILPRYNLSLLPIQIVLSLYLLKRIKPNF